PCPRAVQWWVSLPSFSSSDSVDQALLERLQRPASWWRRTGAAKATPALQSEQPIRLSREPPHSRHRVRAGSTRKAIARTTIKNIPEAESPGPAHTLELSEVQCHCALNVQPMKGRAGPTEAPAAAGLFVVRVDTHERHLRQEA